MQQPGPTKSAGIGAALGLCLTISMLASCGGNNGSGGPGKTTSTTTTTTGTGGAAFTPPPAQTTRLAYNHLDPKQFDNNGNLLGTAKDVWIMNPDGSGQTQLTTNKWDDIEAAFSADGTKITFVSRRAGVPFDGDTSLGGSEQLFQMNADGSNVTQIVGAEPNVSDIDIGPDGTMLFHNDVDYRIYRVRAGDSHQTRLSSGPNKDELPRMSPDATKIVFVSSRDNPAGVALTDQSSIYVMKADGTGATRITNSGPYIRDTEPHWSPDGKKVVFSTNRDQSFDPTAIGTRVAPRGPSRQIYVMNADGTGQTRLTTNTSSDTVPCFSPDGKKIVFASNRDKSISDGNGGLIPGFQTQIYNMNVDGTGVARLTNNSGSDDDPRYTQR